jgi:hypothetical protein
MLNVIIAASWPADGGRFRRFCGGLLPGCGMKRRDKKDECEQKRSHPAGAINSEISH